MISSEKGNQNMRKRGQTLLIVEGNHEKNELFQIVFKSFPELSINMDDVIIYGTNIYKLYEDITKEYGSDWYEIDIDLPFLVSKKRSEERMYKEDFTNIYIIFDYERHDPCFSNECIVCMQKYFSDATDNGQLYISYPMIEAYQDFDDFSLESFIDKKIPVSLKPGAKYKGIIRNKFIERSVSFYSHMYDLLNGHFGISDEYILEKVLNEIFCIKRIEGMRSHLKSIIELNVEEDKVLTAVYQIEDYINKIGYAKNGLDYWEYMRNLFISIIKANVVKAYKIQNGKVDDNSLRIQYNNLNLETILNIQNSVSEGNNGYIWILSTCLFLVAEYNFNLLNLD